MLSPREQLLFNLVGKALEGILADHQDIDCVPGHDCAHSVAIHANVFAELTLAEFERRQGIEYPAPSRDWRMATQSHERYKQSQNRSPS